MNKVFHTEEDIVLTEQEKYDHIQDEAVITEFIFESRKVNAALLRIKNRKSYRPTYSTFESYVEIKWAAWFTDVSRMEILRTLRHEETLQAIEERNVTNWLQNPLPTAQSQTRPLQSMEPEKRAEAWEQAVIENNGNVPTAAQVQQVATNERIGRIDTDTKAKPPAVPRQPHRRGWIENYKVSGADFVLEAHDHPYTSKAGNLVKPKILCSMPLWRVQAALEDAGFIVLSKRNVEGLSKALEIARAIPLDDEQEGSLLAGRDMSQVRSKPQSEDTGVAAQGLMLMLGPDEEDALAKPFEDYPQ